MADAGLADLRVEARSARSARRGWPCCSERRPARSKEQDGRMSEDTQVPDAESAVDEQIVRFWRAGRQRLGLGDLSAVMGEYPQGVLVPPIWTFEDADDALASILAGRKTATSAVLDELEALGSEGVPERGDVAIVLDVAGHPRAVVRADAMRIVRLDEVDAEHAGAELGVEPSAAALTRWRASNDAGVDDPDVLVVLERFTLVHPTPDPSR